MKRRARGKRWPKTRTSLRPLIERIAQTLERIEAEVDTIASSARDSAWSAEWIKRILERTGS